MSVLQTKFLIPRIPPEIVIRQRLLEKLNLGIEQKLVLVSAPAGYGKTTLVAQWLSQIDVRTSWVSLDAEDNNLSRFSHLLALALKQLILPDKKRNRQFEWPQQPELAEAGWVDLINELVPQTQDSVLVLDDFHNIDSRPVLDTLFHLIDRLPPNLHIVMVSRTLPEVALQCLRVRRQVTEIGVEELRFNRSEIATFYDACEISLSTNEIELMYQRTEGWVACLQLAALSMRDRSAEEVHAFIEHFAGSHRHVWDYLFEEIYYQQPAYVREFMLQTSILRQLNDSLCDEVTQRDDSRLIIDRLERAHLLTPLYQQQRWYRYSTIISEFLYKLLQQTAGLPSTYALHERACDWYERVGAMADAVNHAFASQNEMRAGRLLNKMQENVKVEEHFTWQSRFLELPDEVLYQYPEVCYRSAVTAVLSRDLETYERPLRIAERVWEAENYRPGLGKVYQLQAMVKRYRDEHEEAIQFGEKALAYLPPEEAHARASALFVLSMAYFFNGEAASVEPMLIEAETTFRVEGDPYTANLVLASLARVYLIMGRLEESEALYRQISESTDAKLYDQVRTAHFYLGRIYLERNQLEMAETEILKGLKEEPCYSSERHTPGGHIFLARVYEAYGDVEKAQEHLARGLSVAQRTKRQINIDFVKAAQARLAIRQNELEPAGQWYEEVKGYLPATSHIEYKHYFAYATLIRLWIAQALHDQNFDKLQRAEDLAERLLEAAQENGRGKDVIDFLILTALAYHLKGTYDRALDSIDQALTLAQPEGFVRVFVDEGPPMAALLTYALQNGLHIDYIKQLLAEFPQPAETVSMIAGLMEPEDVLTPRQTEILAAIASGLSTQQIVEALVISPHTARTHIKNIFERLEVHNRVQAVEVARERNLI